MTTLRDEMAMAICLAGCGIAAHRSDYFGEADAALSALRKWLADEGLVVVPREATGEMAKVGTEARWQSAVRDANNVREIYRAMLSAAPATGLEGTP